uniref:SUZ domain-containing protein n=2 Tax=Bursaphelenchus xylophilus TaxID=6326 RepID=A0A1I7SSI3_BURXY
MLKQQQQSAAAEEKCLNDEKPAIDQGIGSIIQKPLRLLKREQPTRLSRTSESEDASKALAKLTLDERIANYDKIRERIFNGEDGKKPETSKESTVSNGKSENGAKGGPTEANGVIVEPINHLTHVPMLSEDTRKSNVGPIQPMQIPPPQTHFYHRPMDHSASMIPPMNPHMMMMHGGNPNVSSGFGQTNRQPFPSPAPFVPPPTWMPPPPPMDLTLPYGHPPPNLGQGIYCPSTTAWLPPPPSILPHQTVAGGGRIPPAQPVPLKNIKIQPPNNKSNLSQPSKRQNGQKINRNTGTSKRSN